MPVLQVANLNALPVFVVMDVDINHLLILVVPGQNMGALGVLAAEPMLVKERQPSIVQAVARVVLAVFPMEAGRFNKIVLLCRLVLLAAQLVILLLLVILPRRRGR